MEYRDDLDMAEQKGGVSLDPRYSHYYVTGGFEYQFNKFFSQFSFIHDCIHDIDYEVEGTPVFNRLSFLFASAEYHPAMAIITEKKILWAIGSKLYPHARYHGWDINSGADYQYEFTLDAILKILNNKISVHLSILISRSVEAILHSTSNIILKQCYFIKTLAEESALS